MIGALLRRGIAVLVDGEELCTCGRAYDDPEDPARRSGEVRHIANGDQGTQSERHQQQVDNPPLRRPPFYAIPPVTHCNPVAPAF